MHLVPNILIRNDISFFYAVNKKSNYKFLCNIMKVITELGSTGFAIVFSLMSIYLNRHFSYILILNLVVSQLIIHSVKRLVNRPRPYKVLEFANAIKPPKCKYSLPSGHSSSALTIALVLSFFFPSFMAIFVTLALLVGISRVFLGCHYPSDVLIGMLISFVIYKFIIYII